MNRALRRPGFRSLRFRRPDESLGDYAREMERVIQDLERTVVVAKPVVEPPLVPTPKGTAHPTCPACGACRDCRIPHAGDCALAPSAMIR